MKNRMTTEIRSGAVGLIAIAFSLVASVSGGARADSKIGTPFKIKEFDAKRQPVTSGLRRIPQKDGSVLLGKSRIWPLRKGVTPDFPQRRTRSHSNVKQGYKEAFQRWHQVRAYPEDTYDKSRLVGAARQRGRMPSNLRRPGTDSGLNPGFRGGGTGNTGEPIFANGAKWEFLGPRNCQTIPSRQFFGPANSFISGRVNQVAYNPRNPRNIFLASAGGGVWRTLDGGTNWTPVTDNAFASSETTSVAVHPTIPRIVLVGLGDYHGLGMPGEGIGRSTDGGQTWTAVGTGVLDGQSISHVAFDPDSPNIVVATAGRGGIGTVGGVFRSTNGGQTWAAVATASGGDWSSLSIGARPAEGGNRPYYAARQGEGVYRSDDRGLTWVRLNDLPLRYNGFSGGVGLEVAASSINSQVVYVSDGSGDALDGRIFKSANQGRPGSWTDISGQFPARNEGSGWTQVGYDHHLTTSFTTIGGQPQDIVYVGLLSVLSNIGGGVNWTNITNSLSTNTQIHTDQHGAAFNPLAPNETVFSNDGGVYKGILNPATRTWGFDKGVMNKTLGVSQFYGADWHPTNPDIMLGGTQDNATLVSYGNLADWRIENGGDGFAAAIHSANPNYMCSTAQGGTLFLTPNGGANWFGTAPPEGEFPFFSVIAIVPNTLGSDIDYGPPVGVRPMPIVFDGGDALWRFGVTDPDDGSIWQELGTETLTDRSITAIAVAPSNPNVVYVGTEDGNVWVTGNALDPADDVEWFQLDESPVRNLPEAAVTSISISPRNLLDIYVGVGGTQPEHLWRLVVQFDPVGNLISGWTPQSGIQGSESALPDAMVNSIARDPYDPESTFYVGTDVGVFGSSDNGSTWFNVGNAYGLPNVPVNIVRTITTTGYLNCATFGRGMWRIKINDITGFDMTLSAGLSRLGSQIRTTVTASNNGNEDLTNVRITNASMRLEGSSAAVNPVTPLPLTITPTLVQGTAQSGLVTFNNATLQSGRFVNLTVTAQATSGTSLKSVTKTFRLRLP